jgi:hypothetical protein
MYAVYIRQPRFRYPQKVLVFSDKEVPVKPYPDAIDSKSGSRVSPAVKAGSEVLFQSLHYFSQEDQKCIPLLC